METTDFTISPVSTPRLLPIRESFAHSGVTQCSPGARKVQSRAYGLQMAAYLGLKAAPTITVMTPRRSQLAVTRLQCDGGLSRMSAPIPVEKAFLLSLQLRNVSSWNVRLGGRHALTTSYSAGGVSIINLEDGPVSLLSSPFDCLQFYISRSALNEISDEIGAKRIETLSCPEGSIDPVVSQMGLTILSSLESPESACRLFMDHVVLALHAHFARTYGGMRIESQPVRGGLAAWQVNRAMDLLMAHLNGGASLSQVARECRLSVSHFVRAFRQTTGQPPYRWLLGQRVEVAKDLMMSSQLSLAEVALKCGFADQACFIRTFKRTVDATPGEWRRAHRS